MLFKRKFSLAFYPRIYFNSTTKRSVLVHDACSPNSCKSSPRVNRSESDGMAIINFSPVVAWAAIATTKFPGCKLDTRGKNPSKVTVSASKDALTCSYSGYRFPHRENWWKQCYLQLERWYSAPRIAPPER